MSYNGQYICAVPGAETTGNIASYPSEFKICVSSNYGSTFTQLDVSALWQSVAMSSTGQYICACINNNSTGTGVDKGIYTSINYGVTFQQVISTNALWKSVTMSSDGSIVWAVNSSIANSIYKGTYSSNTYTFSAAATGIGLPTVTTNWQSIAMSSDGTYVCAVVNPGAVYLSSNSGAAFAIPTDPSSNAAWSSVVMSSTGQYMCAFINNSVIGYISANYGVTWTSIVINSKILFLFST
jgi:hypothetical protein